ncbi:MAG: hypothetical protein FMNOHCHN_02634 [Ignavibacteriaceae bacterium]|nr:hypothetical protein [Ignavibacteriaceae bacterium]
MRLLTAQPVFYIPDTSAIITAEAEFADLYRETSPLSRFSSSVHSFALRFAVPLHERFSSRISVSRSGLITTMDKEGDISSAKAVTDRRSVTADAAFSLGGFLLQPSFSVHEQKNSWYYSYSFTASLRAERDMPSPPLWMHIFTRNDPARIEAVAAEQFISVPYVFAESGSHAGGTLLLPGNFSLEGIYRRGYPEKTAEDDDYRGVLALSSELYDAALIKKGKNWKAGIRFSEFRGEGKIDAYYTRQSFSSITLSRAYYKSWSLFSSFLAGKRHRLSAELSHYSARGRASGNIQTWPFSSFLISVFGNRVNAILQGSAELLTLSVKDDILTESMRIIPRVQYFDIRPSFTSETWQPAFLVFGVRDYRRNELLITRSGLLLISSDFLFDYRSWKFTAGLGQFIPVYITKRDAAGPGAPPSGPGVKVQSDGGRWFNLSISYNF